MSTAETFRTISGTFSETWIKLGMTTDLVGISKKHYRLVMRIDIVLSYFFTLLILKDEL